ncbi:MAG: hypothetical protein AAB434_10470 [Planctomycetota bacterium]
MQLVREETPLWNRQLRMTLVHGVDTKYYLVTTIKYYSFDVIDGRANYEVNVTEVDDKGNFRVLVQPHRKTFLDREPSEKHHAFVLDNFDTFLNLKAPPPLPPPKPAAPAAPAAAAPAVPAAPAGQSPKSSAAQSPKSSGAQASKSSGAQAPKSSGAQAPKSSGAQAPKSSGAQAPKSSGQAPKSSAQAPKSSAAPPADPAKS